jgi:hypothetical protein
MSEFERAMQRPRDFFKLSAEVQWAIDKSLSILDWDGGCDHGQKMCKACQTRFKERFQIKRLRG